MNKINNKIVLLQCYSPYDIFLNQAAVSVPYEFAHSTGNQSVTLVSTPSSPRMIVLPPGAPTGAYRSSYRSLQELTGAYRTEW
jgi:hypothetical protein